MQPSEQPWKRPSGEVQSEPVTETLDQTVDQGMKDLSEARRLYPRFPTMSRLCPPRVQRVWVIGGEPGNFKTQLMWNMALNMAEQRYRVLFVSLEMTPGEMSILALCRYSHLTQDRVEEATRKDDPRPFDSREQAAWDAALVKLQALMLRLRIHGAEKGGTRLRDVLHSATRFPYDAVFIDHLGMISREDGQEQRSRVGAVSNALRKLSRGLVNPQCKPFVCASSPLNRDKSKDDAKRDEPRLPRLSDLRGTSDIEYDVDTAIIVEKRKQEHAGEVVPVDAFVLKQRQGRAPLVLQFEAQGSICLITEKRPADVTPPPARDDPEDDA